MGGDVTAGAGTAVWETTGVVPLCWSPPVSAAGRGMSPWVQRANRYSSPANMITSATASAMIFPFLIAVPLFLSL